MHIVYIILKNINIYILIMTSELNSEDVKLNQEFDACKKIIDAYDENDFLQNIDTIIKQNFKLDFSSQICANNLKQLLDDLKTQEQNFNDFIRNKKDPKEIYKCICEIIKKFQFNLKLILNKIQKNIFISDHLPVIDDTNLILTWNIEHDIIFYQQLYQANNDYNTDLNNEDAIIFFQTFIKYKNFIILNIIKYYYDTGYICCLQECSMLLLYLLLSYEGIDKDHIIYTLKPWHINTPWNDIKKYRDSDKNDMNSYNIAYTNLIFSKYKDKKDVKCLFIVLITILPKNCTKITSKPLPLVMQEIKPTNDIYCKNILQKIKRINRGQIIIFTQNNIQKRIINVHMKGNPKDYIHDNKYNKDGKNNTVYNALYDYINTNKPEPITFIIGDFNRYKQFIEQYISTFTNYTYEIIFQQINFITSEKKTNVDGIHKYGETCTNVIDLLLLLFLFLLFLLL